MAVACSSRPSFSMVSRTASAAAQATGLPAEGGAVVAGLQEGGRLAERDAGADRDAAAEPLGDGDDVGVGHRPGEPLAGAADAGLHLVEPEQRAVVAGDLAGGGEVRGGRDDHARLALDRFEDHGRGLVGDGLRECGLVAVRHEGDVAGQRLERRAVRLLRRQRERAHGAAVEGALGGDQVGTAGAPGQLEGRLVGLGAGVGEEHPARRRPTSDSSRSASSTCGALVKKFETWPSVVSCSVTAATSAGWAWPRALTAMPPSRSTYSLPSASQTCAPSPRTRTSFGGPKVFITAPA